MKKLKVNVPIAVYKTVVYEVNVPDDVDMNRLKECIITNGYDAFVCALCDELEKCEVEEVDEYVRDVVSSEMYDGDIEEIK